MTEPPGPTVELIIRVDWRLRECARACREIQEHRPKARWWRIVVSGFLVGLVLLVLLALLGAAIEGNVWAILPWVLVVLLWLVFLGGGVSWLTAWQIRRNNPNMIAGFEHALSPGGYRIRCGSVESTVQWPGFVKVVETTDFFLSYPMRSAAYYIPKRVLAPLEVDTVRRLVHEQLPDRSALLAV